MSDKPERRCQVGSGSWVAVFTDTSTARQTVVGPFDTASDAERWLDRRAEQHPDDEEASSWKVRLVESPTSEVTTY